MTASHIPKCTALLGYEIYISASRKLESQKYLMFLIRINIVHLFSLACKINTFEMSRIPSYAVFGKCLYSTSSKCLSPFNSLYVLDQK